MPVRSFVKGIVRKSREKFYEPVYRQVQSLGKRTETILTSLGIRKVTPETLQKTGINPSQSPETLVIPRNISPFTSKVIYDPRFRRYIDQATKKIISRAEMGIKLNAHRRDVLLTSARQRKPDLSDMDIIDIVDTLEKERKALRDALSEDLAEEIIEAIEAEITGALEELGVESP